MKLVFEVYSLGYFGQQQGGHMDPFFGYFSLFYTSGLWLVDFQQIGVNESRSEPLEGGFKDFLLVNGILPLGCRRYGPLEGALIVLG